VTWFLGIPIRIRIYDDYLKEACRLCLNVRIIPPEERHLTLVYFGEVRPPIEVLKKIINEINMKPFILYFRGITLFPNTIRPRYIVTVPYYQERLFRLREEILTRLSDLYKIKDKYTEFRPHVSLAIIRYRIPLDIIDKMLKVCKRSEKVQDRILVTSIVLYEAKGGKVEIVNELWA